MNMQKRETFLQAARIGLVIILVLSMFAATPAKPVKAASTVFVVGDTGDFATILAAVRNAPPNTLIYVQPGTYTDQIDLRRMGENTPEGARQGNIAIVALHTDNPEEVVVWAGSGMKIHTGNTAYSGSVWIDGIQMSSSNNSVISLVDVAGLLLTNVTINSSGDPTLGGIPVDAISAKFTSGFHTVALYQTSLNNYVGDGLDVQVSGNANVNVLVDTSVFKVTNATYKPQKGVDLIATGTSKAQLTVRATEINGTYNAAISATADGATPVQLSAHIYDNIKMNNVARDPGMNGVQIRATGTGAHLVETWFNNNTITMPNHSDGVELEPAAPGTFSAMMKDTRVEAIAGTGTPLGRGIVIDNGGGGSAALTGKFKLEANNIKNTPGSGIDLHLTTTTAANWGALLTNNYFASVNLSNPVYQEGLHFKVTGAGNNPIFTMLFTGNNMMNNTPANAIRLENSNATFRIVSQLGSASAEIINQNFNFTPYIVGAVNVVRSINAPITENDLQPKVNTDLLVTWMNHPRTYDVMENDVDDGWTLLNYVSPLGKNGGEFRSDAGETPDDRSDDLMVYTPPDTYLGEDSTYYIIQDNLGCSSIGIANSLVIATPLLLPVIQR